jgi:hypothetical protein
VEGSRALAARGRAGVLATEGVLRAGDGVHACSSGGHGVQAGAWGKKESSMVGHGPVQDKAEPLDYLIYEGLVVSYFGCCRSVVFM